MESKAVEIESSVPIKSVVLGVRYEPQYRVRDVMGTLVDTILHAAASPFNPKVFPLSETGPIAQELLNPETGNSIKINQSDTLLEFALPTTELRKISTLGKEFQNFILGPLHKLCGVSRIVRYGLMTRFDEKGTQILQRPTVRYGDPDLPKSRDFVVRFSHRLPTNEGYFRKNVSDFRNVIYTMQENEGQISLSLDYQEYFTPMLEASEWGTHPFPSFVDDSIHYQKTTFAQWVKKLRNVGQAA